VPGQMVPPWQQHDAIGVEAHVFQGVDRSDDFFGLQVDDLDRPVVHALQIEECVLNEAVFPVLGERNVMGARRRPDGFQQFGLGRVLAEVLSHKLRDHGVVGAVAS